MADLKDILYGINLKEIHGNREMIVRGITFDSRKVEKEFLFVAVSGTQSDGHDFIEKAITQGACVIVCEKLPAVLDPKVTYVQTDRSSHAVGIIAANFYGHPSKKMKLVGVTGTNGKTTTATLMYQLFSDLGYTCGLLSTVENRIGTTVLGATHTTPDAIQLNALLAEMLDKGCTHAFMEVSSHALVQGRVEGISFTGALFTNITHDHLDYHGTFDNYIAAKKLLFDMLPQGAFALVNADDKRSSIMLQNTKASKQTFALKSMASYKGRIINNALQGLEIDIDGTVVWCKMIGAFNAYNLLGVYGAACLMGEEKMQVLTSLSRLSGARGRFQYVNNSRNILVIVDYAHTPDALENVLTTIDQLRTKNETLITVVGCGGDRDKTKRPKMAAIANQYSDKVILTSDNPRSEDPVTIIEDMLVGIPISARRKVMRIVDRKEAIRTACQFAEEMDIVLIAGKGHENYQEIKGVKHHFDDLEIVQEFLNTP